MRRTAAVIVTALLAALAALPVARAAGAIGPFAGERLYVEERTAASAQARQWRGERPSDAAALRAISMRPQAEWFGDWGGSVRHQVRRHVALAARADAVPVLVAYDLPHRDCGGQSAGGARSPRAYRSWVRSFAAGIGSHEAAVVLEPDGLTLTGCLSGNEWRRRLASMRRAVATIERRASGADVYIDAGHSGWVPPAVMAARLRSAGIAPARGFALNVSNFQRTPAEVAYGQQLSAQLGGKPFVVDTSRNGLGPAPGGAWCNPAGRALGLAPRIAPGPARVDAYLWIKRPGESDGRCNGGPAAGRFWPEYAVGLAKRAGG